MQIFKYLCSHGTVTQPTIVQWFINLLVAISENGLYFLNCEIKSLSCE